jgi:competence protein ComEA
VQRHVIKTALICLALIVSSRWVLAAGPDPARAGASAQAGSASAAANPIATVKPAALVDINSASRAQLKTLPGIGDAEAAMIVGGRPYLSKVHLATEGVIPTGIYVSIRHRIVALPTPQALAKFRAKAKAAGNTDTRANTEAARPP